MIIPYQKFMDTGKVVSLNNFYSNHSDDVTYCCNTLYNLIKNEVLKVSFNHDPPILIFNDLSIIRSVNYCFECGEKVRTIRISDSK